MKPTFYFDEDSADKALVEALRTRGVDVCVPVDVGLLEADDSEQLQWCACHRCVLITSNIDDFYHLHAQHQKRLQKHSGIVAIQQQSLAIGERMRRLLKLWSTLSAEQMENRIEFLSHWG